MAMRSGLCGRDQVLTLRGRLGRRQRFGVHAILGPVTRKRRRCQANRQMSASNHRVLRISSGGLFVLAHAPNHAPRPPAFASADPIA